MTLSPAITEDLLMALVLLLGYLLGRFVEARRAYFKGEDALAEVQRLNHEWRMGVLDLATECERAGLRDLADRLVRTVAPRVH